MLKQLINNMHWKQYSSVKCFKPEPPAGPSERCFTHATLPLSRQSVAWLHPQLLVLFLASSRHQQTEPQYI